MDETYTIDDAMILAAYRELELTEAIALEADLEESPEMLSIFNDLVNTKNLLPKAQFKPSYAVIDRILNYSAKTTFEAWS
jgi:hypothetical protein